MSRGLSLPATPSVLSDLEPRQGRLGHAAIVIDRDGRSSLAKMLLIGDSLLGDEKRLGGLVRAALGLSTQAPPARAGWSRSNRRVVLPIHQCPQRLPGQGRYRRQRPDAHIDELPVSATRSLSISSHRAARGEQLAGVQLLDILTQHQHREAGPGGASPDRRPAGLRRWSAAVARRGSPPGRATAASRRVRPSLPNAATTTAVCPQQPGQPVPEEDVVLGDNHCMGSPR